MKRFLIFSVLFPPIALIVFIAPETISHLAIPSYFWSSLPVAYPIALVPAWLFAAFDWALSAKPAHIRIFGTAGAAALTAAILALFLWGSFRFFPLWPTLMAALVGAVPAAICSWLSGKQFGAR